jgi:hypothetical protein
VVVCDGAPDVTGLHDLDSLLAHHLVFAALGLSAPSPSFPPPSLPSAPAPSLGPFSTCFLAPPACLPAVLHLFDERDLLAGKRDLFTR